ncbi:GntR family transcriptional regulator [Salipaludibacillus agaradhaerens]|uniref:GntR family transcriptional regulator n=1 Tax=Salipaludibacillus agaradhaerens TaxID=76935 RepID=UPI00215084F9|nr:GntR family transcriptional regulator [Salipaludibacillus agaradhaerens]MCR6105153.1 GntR family transcriptional regulator [Salipaludibacillus agaradhaerens]MCR6117198.1 GntR family transcriptional regulator [Salipaludibacillus agaradhaerens]UJW56393.1 GntR family transcriptional regulator [Bacillus sp. A116_S68]
MSELLPITINENSRTPIYDQIETQLKALIVSGKLPAGTALPSIRKLASTLSCSVITTRRSYQNLEQHGYIKTVQGKGTFVAEIDIEDQDIQKQEAVKEVLSEAIRIGKSYQYSHDELSRLFQELLKEADQYD